MSRRRRIWVSIAGILLTAVVAGTIVIQRWMSGDNQGTVHVGTPSGASTEESPQITKIQTTYFTTELPGGFVVKRQTEAASSSSLVQVVANTPSATDQQFAVTVATLPAAGIKEVGDYHLRETQKGTYAPFTFPDLPAGSVAFKNTQGPASFTVFWPHEGRYAEISLSTDGLATLEQLQTTFQQAIPSWQWL